MKWKTKEHHNKSVKQRVVSLKKIKKHDLPLAKLTKRERNKM
jgi:hypothetical protein